MATIYCMGCGRPLEEGTRFCPDCGAPTRRAAGLDADVPRASRAARGAVPVRDTVPAREVVPSTPTKAPVAARHGLPKGSVALGALVAALALGLGLAAGVASGSFGGRGSAADVAQDVPAPSDKEQDTDAPGTAGIPVRASLADYSWQELSIIGKEMTRRASRNEALALAHEYGLTDELGHMTTVTRRVEVAGLGSVEMRLADVYHDPLANGEGVAGLTFLSADATLAHQMKANDDNIGGWEASQMRAWLGSEVMGRIDAELAPLIVAVDKHTNNVGATTSTSSVTSTLDALWIPSVVEVCGPVGWLWDSDPANSEAYNAVLAAEGSQYACFAEQGVDPATDNAALVLAGAQGPTAWWLRSSSASKAAHFRMVDEAGNPSRWGEGPVACGVCLGFCL